MTLAQWRKDAQLRPALAAILSDPTMIAALQIVTDQGCPTSACPINVNLIHYSALTGAWKEGYREALDNLRNLTTTTPRDRIYQKPWTVDPKSMPQETFLEGTSAPQIPTLTALQKEGLQPKPEPIL